MKILRLSGVSIFKILLFAIIPALTLVAYWPGISPYLAFDDYAHIAPLAALLNNGQPLALWEATWSASHSGLFGRPIPMATIAIQMAYFNAGPEQLKTINILIHLANGLLIYKLLALLIAIGSTQETRSNQAYFIALAVAAIWLLHPINVTSVLYLIQRMNSLATLFMLLALCSYIKMRLDADTIQQYVTCSILILFWGLCGLLSKENAVLLPLYILLLEYTVLRYTPFQPAPQLTMTIQRWLAVTIFVVGAVTAWLLLNHILVDYAERPFDLTERLLTQARVLSWYLYLIVSADISHMSLFQDHWQVSTSLLEPLSTLSGLILIATLIMTVVLLRSRYPLISFAIGWFIIGHLLESTFIPLELVFEHRNYMPSMGIILLLLLLLHRLAGRIYSGSVLLSVIFALALAYLSFATYQRAHRWGEDPQARIEHLATQSKSVRATIELAQIYSALARRSTDNALKTKYLAMAERAFKSATELNPESPTPLFGWILHYADNDKTIPDSRLEQLAHSLATAQLSASDINGIHALTGCVVNGRCQAISKKLEKYFAILLSRSDLSKGTLNRIYRDYASLVYFVEHNRERTEAYYKKAIEYSPKDIHTLTEFAVFLARENENEQALKLLQKAAALDEWGRYGFSLRNLRYTIITGHHNQQNNSSQQQ